MKLRIDISDEYEGGPWAIECPAMGLVFPGADVLGCAQKGRKQIEHTLLALQKVADASLETLSAKGLERLERMRLLDRMLACVMLAWEKTEE